MQLSIFDELDAQILADSEMQKRLEDARIALIQEQNRKPVQCDHCGDWSPNSYLYETNHGKPSFYDMPGVCVKHWFMFNQARWDCGTDARQWLSERGFALPTEVQKRVK